jgi:membrane protein YqaA with SNARE-associated domain
MKYINLTFKRIHNNSIRLAGTKWADAILFALAVADASFFPLPITTFFIMLLLMKNSSAVRYVGIISLGFLTGAIIGYLTGHFIWLTSNGDISGFGHFILNNVPGFSEHSYDKMHLLYTRYGVGLLFVSNMTPIPYGIFSVSSGVFNINIFLFGLTTLISQIVKYTFISIVFTKIGTRISNLKPLRPRLRLRLLTVRA